MSDGGRGRGRGRFYCSKPVTKLGFELWSGRFRLSCVTFEHLESGTITAAFPVSLSWNIDRFYCDKLKLQTRLFYREHVQSLITWLAAEPWRAWWTTWRMKRGTAKQWTDTVPFISWMMITMKMMKRWDPNLSRLLLDVAAMSCLVLCIKKVPQKSSAAKLQRLQICFPRTGDTPPKGHSSPRRAENNEENSGEPPQRPERCQKPGLQQKRGQ